MDFNWGTQWEHLWMCCKMTLYWWFLIFSVQLPTNSVWFKRLLIEIVHSDSKGPTGQSCTLFVSPFPGKLCNRSQTTSYQLLVQTNFNDKFSVVQTTTGSVCDILEFPFSPPLFLFSTDETTNVSCESGCRGTLELSDLVCGQDHRENSCLPHQLRS